jgi:hypothetical protein
VTVPTVHRFDGAHHAIVMDDAGPRAQTLKAALLAGRISPSRGAALGRALGEFLRELHARGREDEDEDGSVGGGNVLGKELSVFATYGRLGSTLRALDRDRDGDGDGESERALLRSVLGDEPLGVSDETLRVIEALAERRAAQIMEPTAGGGTDATFVMGDFWPGNILVVQEDEDGQGRRNERPCFVVDWELAKVGQAGLDVGQFCAELATLRRLRPGEDGRAGAAAGETLASFLRAYFAGGDGDGVGGHRAEETRRVAVGHFGAHLVVWTPRVGWEGGAGPTRTLMLDGVARLVEGADADRVWTDEELVQTFLR